MVLNKCALKEAESGLLRDEEVSLLVQKVSPGLFCLVFDLSYQYPAHDETEADYRCEMEPLVENVVYQNQRNKWGEIHKIGNLPCCFRQLKRFYPENVCYSQFEDARVDSCPDRFGGNGEQISGGKGQQQNIEGREEGTEE